MFIKISKRKKKYLILLAIIISTFIFLKNNYLYRKVNLFLYPKTFSKNAFFLNIYSESVLEEPSGLTIDTANKVLWTVCDENINVVKMDYSGNILFSFPIDTGQTKADIEGIHYDPSSKHLFIVLENHTNEYDENGIVIYDTNGNSVKHQWIKGFGATDNDYNSGFEAITIANNHLFIGKEKNDPLVIKFNKKLKIVDQKNVSKFLKDVSGIFYSGHKETFFLLSEASKKIIYWDFTKNKIDDSKTIILNMGIKPEGIAVDFNVNKIFIVSDSGGSVSKTVLYKLDLLTKTTNLKHE